MYKTSDFPGRGEWRELGKKATSEILRALTIMGMLTLALSIQLVTSESSVPPDTEWSQTYGGVWRDFAYSVVQTGDGGYALAGETSSLSTGWGWPDFWLVKTDQAGNMLWSRTYGGSSDDGALSMIQTFDGGYALTGYTGSYGAGSYDFWLVKTDSIGNMQWSRTYGGIFGDIAYSVVQTSDGGYAIAGYTSSFGNWLGDFWLVKTDGSGVMQWSQTYGGTGGDYAYDVVQTRDGGYAIVGYTNSYGAGSSDFWLVKTDQAGNMLWNQTYGGGSYEGAESVLETGDGGYAIVGYTNSYGAGGTDFWLVKTDVAGNMLWSRTYGGTGLEFARSVVETSAGGFIVVGYTDSYGAGAGDCWLVKTDPSGNTEWNKTCGGTSQDEARSVAKTTDGGYAIVGATQSFGAGWEDFWLIKLAAEQLPSLPAAMAIDPGTLNLGSKGQWITAYIQLPEGYNAADIDAATILLNGTITPVLDPTYGFVTNSSEYSVDHNNNGILERMVKFDRVAVESFIISKGISNGNAALTITGKLHDGTQFEGTDFIFVFYGGGGGRRK